eukprot:m.12234 g.12234  ORF g.12234 m.12234 type:complete len:203 (-) comp6785_c0_seq1:26-634(-)
MALNRKRCVMQKCTGWEFQVGMCRNCCTKHKELAAAIPKYQHEEPLFSGLIVTQEVDSPSYLELKPGDRVDIMDVLADNNSVIVRAQNGDFGYWAMSFLTSDDEVLQEEQQRLEQEAQRAVLLEKEAKLRAEEEARMAEVHLEERRKELARLKFQEQEEKQARQKAELEKRAEEMKKQREKEELDKLPDWKRNLVLKKRGEL